MAYVKKDPYEKKHSKPVEVNGSTFPSKNDAIRTTLKEMESGKSKISFRDLSRIVDSSTQQVYQCYNKMVAKSEITNFRGRVTANKVEA